jgi:prepilin-type N-terminal cleavage/methylation domain-containing protein
MRRAFTLTELMIVIAIIAIMAGLGLSAMNGATNLAREHRTEGQIRKIDLLLMEKWESYRTRMLPIRIPARWGADTAGNPAPTDGKTASTIRLNAMRDLMRMELPDRITDLTDGPVVLYARPIPPYANETPILAAPALYKQYRKIAQRNLGANWATLWTPQYQGAECLYLILSAMTSDDKRALDHFDSTEIGDVDGDGMKEILDGWGNPIEFLRWAPGYISTAAVPLATPQIANGVTDPDYFDPSRADPRWYISGSIKPFILHPLIVSGGRDKQIDIAMRLIDTSGNQFRYSTTTPPNDPYYVPNNSNQVTLGTPVDADGDGPGWADNITNHAR